MRQIPSPPRAVAAVAAATLTILFLLAVVAVPAVEAQQAGAGEEEVAARVRAELQARLAQINQRLMEHMREIDGLRSEDLERLQREIEELHVNDARVRQLVEETALRAGAVERRAAEQAERRYEEAMHRAMVSAEQAMQRARGVSTFRLRGGCGVFGDTVLDFADDLELSDEQIDAIREAQRATRRAAIERDADIEVGEMDLEALYESEEPDLAAIRTQLEEIAMLRVAGQMAGLELRQQVRAILTPAQREELEDMRPKGNVRVIISGAGSTWRSAGLGC
jgi:Spy/CpxP family protein refolding chaperone